MLCLTQIRFFSSKMIERNLFSVPVTVKNQFNESISLNAVYQDSIPDKSAVTYIRGTCIGIHGSPGSHQDFKYVEPTLTKAGIRFIGINFPGFGYSSYDERLKNDNFERNQVVQQIIDGLNLKENLIFMGHSRGNDNALISAAENHEKTEALILLNPIGLRKSRSMNWRIYLLSALWAQKELRFFSNWLLYTIYSACKVKVKTGHESGVTAMTLKNAFLEKQRPYIDIINKSNVKVFMGASGKDWMIDPPVSKEFMAHFENMEQLEAATKGDDDETISKVLEHLKNGKKSVGVFFENEGHFLQKYRANLVKAIVMKCLNAV